MGERARKALLELPVILPNSFTLVFGFVRAVVASPFYVGSQSMVPTLEVWDRTMINKLAYDLEEPWRGPGGSGAECRSTL